MPHFPRFYPVFLCFMAMVGLGAPAETQAAYTVHACSLPDGQPAGLLRAARDTGGWKYRGVQINRTLTDPAACSQPGGAVTVSGTGLNGQRSVWTFQAPAATRISGYRIQRQITHAARRAVTYSLHATRAARPGGRPEERCNDQLTCAQLPAIAAATGLTGVRFVHAQQRCNRKAGCAAGDRTDITAAAFDLVDVRAPRLDVSGSVFVAGAPVPAQVTVRAADHGSGLYAAQLLSAGRVIAQSGFGGEQCVDRVPETPQLDVMVPRPCPPSGQLTFTVDPAVLGDGVHQLEIAAIDASGNRRVSGRRATVTWPAGAPVTSLTVEHRRLRPDRTLAVTYGAQVTLRGVMSDASGAPVAGAPVRVFFAGHAHRVRTTAAGVWTVRMRARRSGRVTVRHAVFGNVAATPVRVNVTPRVRVRVRRRPGRMIVVSGVARGVPDGRRATVEIRKVSPGFGYQTAARLRVRDDRVMMRRPILMPAGVYDVRLRALGVLSEPVRVTVR